MPGRRSSIAAPWPPPLPPDVNDEAREERIRAEAEAKRISDNIDHELSSDKEIFKRKQGIKILLLGQAESGKSTILKNFQLIFSPQAFQADAEAWRPVIHLNLVRSVNFIINVLSNKGSLRPATSSSTASPPSSVSGHDHNTSVSGPMSDALRRYLFKLAPLKSVEDSLTKYLIGPIVDDPSRGYNPQKASEFSVRSNSGWKLGFMKWRRSSSSSAGPAPDNSEETRNRRLLSACAEDIVALWEDEEVQKELVTLNVNLQDQSGFFLSDTARIASFDYQPTPDDIVRARMHTIGPEEHKIPVETSGPESGKTWYIYDVGGSRSQRAAWAQFFDDVHVIIFMAPISAFDQFLAEDDNVNRLADTLSLWQKICSNRLLASVELILFLNKLDILKKKIDTGAQFSQFVTSYKKGNDVKSITKYLLDVFVLIHSQNSPKKRRIHPHLTCAIDTRATATVIGQVKEVILLKALQETSIL